MRISHLATFWKHYRWLVLWLATWKVSSLVMAWLATFWLPLQLPYALISSKYAQGFPYLAWVWGNFDGYHYLQIADEGYKLPQVPYFPLYSLVLRAFEDVLSLPWLVVGILISTLCFFMSLVVMKKLVDLDKGDWKVFLGVLLLFPTSFFLTAVYNDAIFLVLACLCLYFARLRRWWLAGIFGFVAALARINGIALMVFLGVEFMLQNDVLKKQWQLPLLFKRGFEAFQLQTWKKSAFWVWTLVVAGFLSYLGYIHLSTGSHQNLFGAMEVWNQDSMVFPPKVIWWYLKIFMSYPMNHYMYWVAVIEFVAIMGYLIALVWGWGKIRVSYWLFILASLLIPWLSGSFSGMPRYALHLYPLFLLLSLWIAKQPKAIKIVYAAVMVLLTLVITAFFTRGYFIT